MINLINLKVFNSIDRSIILKEIECMPNWLNNVIRHKCGLTVSHKMNTKRKTNIICDFLTKPTLVRILQYICERLLRNDNNNLLISALGP